MHILIKTYGREVQEEALRLKAENPTWDDDTIIYETMDYINDYVGEDVNHLERHLKDFLKNNNVNNSKMKKHEND